MTTFDRREEAFEKKFAIDQELLFKASARRNRMLGIWAAEKLGKTGADAEAYAKSVVMSDLAEAGDRDVLHKVLADLQAAGIDQTEHQVAKRMEEFMAEAVAQLRAER